MAGTAEGVKYLHTMLRVSDPEETLRFFALLGLRELRRQDSEAGRFTLIFLAAPGDEDAQIELTHNWDQRGYEGGVTINRPPRDGRMAFVKTPDGISVELLQAGDALPPAEPWLSMPTTGTW
jgi:lactoylglutathione lyase